MAKSKTIPEPKASPAARRTRVGYVSPSVLGRIPAERVLDLLQHTGDRNAPIAWCGGGDLPHDLEAVCPIVVVNREDAIRMLDAESQTATIELALGLSRRAKQAGAIRVVTGGGSRPIALVRESRGVWECLEADPVAVSHPRHLAGVGDVFAARLLSAALAENPARLTAELPLADALQLARFAAAGYIADGVQPTTEEIEAAVAARPEYRPQGVHAVRSWSVPKPGGFVFNSLNWHPRPLV
ncbi:hypothetical protein [Paludisphaera rhizosphaerae]|uniref:hypothetical protein n=1 Tax=Paludisphaera rhizosphaerae TaxID=2711216 RepID=UPI0013EB272F|nr:hypothetical protein [Paludisphaera rhizosphaerae]